MSQGTIKNFIQRFGADVELEGEWHQWRTEIPEGSPLLYYAYIIL